MNTALSYKTNYKIGMGYRDTNALVAFLGYRLNNQFALGYSYDLKLGKFASNFGGAHEINVQYKFGYKVNASSPRGF